MVGFGFPGFRMLSLDCGLSSVVGVRVFSDLRGAGSGIVDQTLLIRNDTDDPRGAPAAAIGQEITDPEPNSRP